mmetsp:Transcript_132666/g.383584  ORF Transcript_132666/g.383584 Transcript_132666/m.383584 type:complete len:218 (+) Transcript_132666:309-962(+)
MRCWSSCNDARHPSRWRRNSSWDLKMESSWACMCDVTGSWMFSAGALPDRWARKVATIFIGSFNDRMSAEALEISRSECATCVCVSRMDAINRDRIEWYSFTLAWRACTTLSAAAFRAPSHCRMSWLCLSRKAINAFSSAQAETSKRAASSYRASSILDAALVGTPDPVVGLRFLCAGGPDGTCAPRPPPDADNGGACSSEARSAERKHISSTSAEC